MFPAPISLEVSHLNAVFRAVPGGARPPGTPPPAAGCGTAAGLVGIVVNLLLSLGKLLAGALTASVAITADGLNNLSDAATSVVTLAGFRLAGTGGRRRAPLRPRPLGVCGRPHRLPGHPAHGHRGGPVRPGLPVPRLRPPVLPPSRWSSWPWPSWAKFGLFWFNRSLGGLIGSAAMEATAADSLSDCLSTGVVLVSALAGHFWDLRVDGLAGPAGGRLHPEDGLGGRSGHPGPPPGPAHGPVAGGGTSTSWSSPTPNITGQSTTWSITTTAPAGP